MRQSQISLIGQSLFYIAGGVNHFWHSPFYVHIMPDHYADPRAWVQLTGAAEIAGGVGLLVPATRRAAAISIAAMLVGYFDVHIFMLQHAERFPEIPKWILWMRIPLQFALIAWALNHAGAEKSNRSLAA